MNRLFLALALAGALAIPTAAAAAKPAAGGDVAALKAEFAAYRAESDAKIAALENRLRELESAPASAPAAPAAAPAVDSRTLGRGSSLELPDISVIGNITGTYGSDKGMEDLNRVLLDESEFAFQGYLYPDLRADVIAAIHRHDGEYATHLEEGYLTFLRTRVPGLSLKVGEKLVEVGKTNGRHPHHWAFVDRPYVLESTPAPGTRTATRTSTPRAPHPTRSTRSGSRTISTRPASGLRSTSGATASSRSARAACAATARTSTTMPTSCASPGSTSPTAPSAAATGN